MSRAPGIIVNQFIQYWQLNAANLEFDLFASVRYIRVSCTNQLMCMCVSYMRASDFFFWEKKVRRLRKISWITSTWFVVWLCDVLLCTILMFLREAKARERQWTNSYGIGLYSVRAYRIKKTFQFISLIEI